MKNMIPTNSGLSDHCAEINVHDHSAQVYSYDYKTYSKGRGINYKGTLFKFIVSHKNA